MGIKNYNYNLKYMYKYNYMEDSTIYDICHENKQNYIKCATCSFNCCCRCFNNIYLKLKVNFKVEVMCRLITHYSI